MDFGEAKKTIINPLQCWLRYPGGIEQIAYRKQHTRTIVDLEQYAGLAKYGLG